MTEERLKQVAEVIAGRKRRAIVERRMTKINCPLCEIELGELADQDHGVRVAIASGGSPPSVQTYRQRAGGKQRSRNASRRFP